MKGYGKNHAKAKGMKSKPHSQGGNSVGNNTGAAHKKEITCVSTKRGGKKY